jgi:hypothetical protein
VKQKEKETAKSKRAHTRIQHAEVIQIRPPIEPSKDDQLVAHEGGSVRVTGGGLHALDRRDAPGHGGEVQHVEIALHDGEGALAPPRVQPLGGVGTAPKHEELLAHEGGGVPSPWSGWVPVVSDRA